MAGLEILLFAIISQGAQYVIIAPDQFVDELEPLVEWRMDNGFSTVVVPLSLCGSTEDEIRDFLMYAYENWDPPPQYILLAGSASIIPFHFDLTGTDCYYANLDTTDIENETYIGRLPAESESDVALMVEKILSYEVEPDTASHFLEKATLIVRCDNDEDDSLYFADAYYVGNLMLESGFSVIDTFSSCPPYMNGAQDVIDALEEGRGYILYRGQGVTYWWSPFQVDPYYVYNGKKLPIIVSATCQTVSAYPNFLCVGEKWLLVGYPGSVRGASAFFGTTTIRSDAAQIRSVIARGFFEAIFEDSVQYLGVAAERARLKLLNELGDIYDYEGFTLLGDPLMRTWAGSPEGVDIIHPLFADPGETVTVQVLKAGTPLSGARVVLRHGSLMMLGETNETGLANFILPPTPCTLTVTVTGFDVYPYRGRIIVGEEGQSVLLEGYEFLDENSNGRLNPGEVAVLRITLFNAGSSPINELQISLHSYDSLVTLIDSFYTITGFSPDESTTVDFSFELSPYMENNHISELVVQVGDSLGIFTIPFVCYAPSLRMIRWWFEYGGSYSYLTPGSEATMNLELVNYGGEEFQGRINLLFPPPVAQSDSVFYGSVGVGDTLLISLTLGLSDSVSPFGYVPLVLIDSSQFGTVHEESAKIYYGAFFYDDFKEESGWVHFSSGGWGDEWHIVSEGASFIGSKGYACNSGLYYSSYLDSYLVSPEFPVNPGSYLLLFYRISTENPQGQYSSDGAYVALVGDSGIDIIEPLGGYPYTSSGNSAIPAGTGILAGSTDWKSLIFPLEGRDGFYRILIRFSSDGQLQGSGLYVDDFIVGDSLLIKIPHVRVDSVSYHYILSEGENYVDSIKIKNIGLDTLTFYLMDSLPSWLNVYPVEMMVPPGSYVFLYLEMNAQGFQQGYYKTSLKFETNDPVTEQINLSIEMELTNTEIVERGKTGTFYLGSSIVRGLILLSVTDAINFEVVGYDVSGRRVFAKKGRGPGTYRVGEGLASGVYFLVFKWGGERRFFKIVKLR